MAGDSTGDVLSRRINTVREHIRYENAHDLAALMDTFGSEANYHDEPWDEHHMGWEAVRSFYDELLRVLPDLRIEVTNEHVSNDAVIVECVIRGTQQSAWRGLPPTGQQLEFPLCGVYTFDSDGKLAGEKIYYDRATILRQLGVFRETSTSTGRFLLFMNHPIAIVAAWLRGSKRAV